MKVLVTDGSGYIGQATIATLRRGGHEVTAHVRGEQAAQAVAGLGATPVTGTLGDPSVPREAAASADGVIHLAQVRGPQTARIDRDAAAALQDGADAGLYVHIGGIWVYGNTCGLVTEDAPLALPSLVACRPGNEKQVLACAASGGHPIVAPMTACWLGWCGGLRADTPIREAPMEMAGKLAPGRQSGHTSSGPAVRDQVARIGNRPSGFPHTRLGRPGRGVPCCVAGTVAIADWGAVDA